MSDEGFLKRWSRRKRAELPAAEAPPADHPASEHPPPGEAGATPRPAAQSETEAKAKVAAAGKPDEEAFDPATLPPIETLGPDSDYTMFLRKGVPEAIKLAALRKAWLTDPAIRDFPSPAADYGWDFNTPEYLLRPTDDVEKMLDKILPRRAERDAAADAPAPAEAASEPEDVKPETPPDLKLPQNQAEAMPASPARETAASMPAQPRRKHGGALPD